MGLEFDIDVAGPPGGLPWIPAQKTYTETDDGLAQPWAGLIWCNPPYSAPFPWCRRYATHPEGIILLRADLSSGGPYAAFTASDAMFVPFRRLQFINGHGDTHGSVAFSTVLLARGPKATAGLTRLDGPHGSTRILTKGRPQ